MDRGIGRAISTASIDIGVELFNKRLDDMTDDELREFGARYDAIVNQVPKVIEHAIEWRLRTRKADIVTSYPWRSLILLTVFSR